MDGENETFRLEQKATSDLVATDTEWPFLFPALSLRSLQVLRDRDRVKDNAI